MSHQRHGLRIGHVGLVLAATVLLAEQALLAAAGTSIVAVPGQAAAGRPKEILAVINDPVRTYGWNPWFSEMPNDVCTYGFKVRNVDDVNRLIRKLANIKTKVVRIRLQTGKQPRYLGIGMARKTGNGLGAVFSLGNQRTLDSWFQRLTPDNKGVRHFGKMRLKKPWAAMPPTLQLHVGHAAVDLQKLEVPLRVEVVSPYTKKQRAKLEDAEDATFEAIESFVSGHRAKQQAAKRKS